MRFFLPKNYSTMLAVLVGVLIVLGALNSLVTMWRLHKLVDQQTLITQHNIPELLEIRRLQIAVIQVQQWLTDISATRGLDGLNDGFDEAEKYAHEAREAIATLQRLETFDAARAEQLEQMFATYYSVGQRMARCTPQKLDQAVFVARAG